MVRQIPTIPQRMAIALYSSVLLIVLLSTTAIGLRNRSAIRAESAAVAQGSTRTAPASATADISPTATERPSATPTARASDTAGASPTASHTPTRTPTHTPSPTNTPTQTVTPSPTFTPSLTFTPSPTPTATYTPTPYPTPGPGAANRKVCSPILMYHHIGYAPADADDIERGLTTSPGQFEQHLRLFQENGVVPISLDDLLYALALGWPLPEKPVIITIDDGYADVYQNAFPLLEKYGYPATLFIATSFVDKSVPGYMTWPQIEEMAAAGIDVQPHTKDHLDLRERKRDFLVYQILGSKETIEAHTGRVARYFNYPAGAYDDNVIALLQEMNFWAAVSTDSGVVHSLDTIYTLKRLRVSNSIDRESMLVYLRFCGFEVH